MALSASKKEPENHAAPFRAQPLGEGRGEHLGRGGGVGMRPRSAGFSGRSGRRLARGMPVSLARSLPRRARGRESRDRDRRADSPGHKTLLCLTPPGRWRGRLGRGEAAGTRHRGSCASGGRCGGGSEHNGSCGPVNDARRSHRRASMSTVGGAVPSCQPPNGAELKSAGSRSRRFHRIHAPRSGRAERDTPAPVSGGFRPRPGAKREPTAAGECPRSWRRRSGAQGRGRKQRSQAARGGSLRSLRAGPDAQERAS